MKPNKKMRAAISLGKQLQKKIVKCVACNGTGHYDNNRSPICAACNGTGITGETK